MSGGAQAHRAPGRRAGAGRNRLKLAVLLGCAFGLIVFAIIDRGGILGHAKASCPGDGAPEVTQVVPSRLGTLRTSIAGVLPGRVGRLYEEGPVTAGDAFTDNQPLAPAVSPTARRPAAYEMRWWSPNRDDIVADVFEFADVATAQRFLERALSTRCRISGQQAPVVRPAQGGNLAWVNPDGYAQADIYLSRGRRVDRVGEVPAGMRTSRLLPGGLRRAFYTVDTLACLIPSARCEASNRAAPA